MKTIKSALITTFIIVILSNHCLSQTYSLLSRKWNKPIIQKDTITNDDLNQGYFPIYTSEIDTLVVVLNKLQNVVNGKKEREVINMSEYATPHITFDITTVKEAYGDRYVINMISSGQNYKVSLQLTDINYANSQNVKRIKAFTEYIGKGKNAGLYYHKYD
jgi:hypothetical protein